MLQLNTKQILNELTDDEESRRAFFVFLSRSEQRGVDALTMWLTLESFRLASGMGSSQQLALQASQLIQEYDQHLLLQTVFQYDTKLRFTNAVPGDLEAMLQVAVAAQSDLEKYLTSSLLEYNREQTATVSILSPDSRVIEIISRDTNDGRESLKSGTLETILEWLLIRVPTKVFFDEATWLIYGYRCYATPTALLDRLESFLESTKNDERGKARLFDFVKYWVILGAHWDLSSKEMVSRTLALAEDHMPKGLANEIKLWFLRKRPAPWQETYNKLVMSATSGGGAMRPEWTPEMIAEQLTLIEAQLYYSVMADEFLDKAWQRDDKSVKAPTLAKLAERFNQVSFWVSTRVLSHGSSRRKRVKEIKRFISVMEHLLELHNYNGLMEVMAGLNNSAIARLKEDWEQLSTEKLKAFKSMETLMDAHRNFKAYREHLDPTKSGRKSSDPCIPAISIHLRDILFIEIGNPDAHKGASGEERLIDYEKVLLFGNAIAKLCFFQRHPYSIVALPELYRFLWTVDHLTNEELHEKSIDIRPPISEAAMYLGSEPAIPSSKAPNDGSFTSRSLISHAAAMESDESYVYVVNPLLEALAAKSQKELESAREGRMSLAQLQRMKSFSAFQDITLIRETKKSAERKASATDEEWVPVEAEESLKSGGLHSVVLGNQLTKVPLTSSENLALLKSRQEGRKAMQELRASCDADGMMLTSRQLARTLAVTRWDAAEAYSRMKDYWEFYKNLGYRTLIVSDCVSVLLSGLLEVLPGTDHTGCAMLLFRANMYSKSGGMSEAEVMNCLMYLGECMAESVSTQYAGVSVIMDLKNWTKKNFNKSLYRMLFRILWRTWPVACVNCLLVDSPKGFVSSLRASTVPTAFKSKIVRVSRASLLNRASNLPTDLGGKIVSDANAWCAERKLKEKEPQGISAAEKEEEELEREISAPRDAEEFQEKLRRNSMLASMLLEDSDSEEDEEEESSINSSLMMTPSPAKPQGVSDSWKKKDKSPRMPASFEDDLGGLPSNPLAYLM